MRHIRSADMNAFVKFVGGVEASPGRHQMEWRKKDVRIPRSMPLMLNTRECMKHRAEDTLKAVGQSPPHILVAYKVRSIIESRRV